MSDVDHAVDDIIAAHGFKPVLAALCRHCHKQGMNPVIFRRLNKIYEWLTEHDAKRELTQ